LLCLGMHLQLSPVHLAQNFFLRPRGARAPTAPLATHMLDILLLAQ